jgi:hypothetical protein
MEHLTHYTRHFRGVRTVLIAAALAGALTGILLASQHASAYGVNYCTGWEPSGGSCVGPEHTITANIVYDDTGSNAFVCEIAQYPGGGYYGGWGCGYGVSESCYPGNQLLKGEIYNDSIYWLYMNGTEFYSQGCP